MASPGILITIPTTSLVLILLPLGRYYTRSTNVKKDAIIVQLVQQPEVRLVDKLSMAQHVLLWQRQFSSTLACTGISSSSRDVIQPLYSTLVRPIWSAVPSSGFPSRRKDLWSLPVLGDAQNQTGMGKIPSNLLEVTLL